MDIEDLRAAQSRERATDGLQDLRDSFYEDVAEYIQTLKDKRDARAAELEDPFGDPRVQELNDEIETAEQVAEAIYERRMGKLVKQASLAAADMTSGQDGLTQEEKSLFGDLVARIRENKRHVLDVISGEKKPPAPPQDELERGQETPKPASDADGDGDEAASDSSAAAAMGGGLAADADDASPAEADIARAVADDDPSGNTEPDSADSGEAGETEAAVEAEDVERTTVRITQDVGEIFGLDGREYTLAADDVVTLPTENADPLLERDAAEKLSR
jgi:DNA replication factor GINS